VPSPFEKHIITVSAFAVHSRIGMPVATLAFQSRAPSRCNRIRFARVNARSARR
jgi:hypothetical protein